MEEVDLTGLTPVTDPDLIAVLEQPQTAINKGGQGGEGADADKATQRAGNLRALQNQINRVRELFNQDIRGNGVLSATEYLPTPANRRFDSAGAGLAELGLAAFRVPGVGSQSDAELRAFVEANRPQAGDYDSQIEEKLRNLENRLQEAAKAQGIDLNASSEPAPAVGAAAKGGDPSSGAPGSNPPPNGPGGPLGEAVVSQDGSMAYATDRDKAFAAEAQKAFDSGASRAEINALAVSWGYPPYGADLDNAISYRDKGGKGARIAPAQSGYQGPSLVGSLAASPLGSYAIGAANAVTGNSLDDIVGFAGGDVERAREAQQIAREANPLSSFAGEVSGAALATTGLARLTGAGALAADVGYGAIYGSGDDENPIMGTLVGAGSAFAGHTVASKVSDAAGAYLATRSANKAARTAQRASFTDAAQRQGVSYLPADVPGATATRMASGVTKMTLGGIPLSEAAEKTIETVKASRDRIASGLGLVRDQTGAGQAAQKGARAFMDRSEARAGELYERIPIPTEFNARLGSTRTALSELTEGFRSNPELSKLWAENPRLQATLQALTPGEGAGALSWADLKRFRSIVGEIAGKPGLAADGNQIAAMRKLYGALSDDMLSTAQAYDAVRPRGYGRSAVQSFERANKYWRGREARIENVLTEVLGSDGLKGGDAAFARIEALSQGKGGDPIQLARLMRSLSPDEAETVQATILSRLGTVTKGRQDQTGEVFSPSDFMTHWSGLSERSKAILFKGEHRKALDDLVTVADGMKQSAEFANLSRTSLGTNALALAGLFWANPILGLSSAGLQFGAGKMLANPRFAQWLSRAAKKPNPSARLAHVQQLTPIARATAETSPIIAQDILSLQQRLAEAFTAAPTRLAADEGNNKGNGVDRQNQQNRERPPQAGPTP